MVAGDGIELPPPAFRALSMDLSGLESADSIEGKELKLVPLKELSRYRS